VSRAANGTDDGMTADGWTTTRWRNFKNVYGV
jgi:hypothetical protein